MASGLREDLSILSGGDELAAWLYRPSGGDGECGCVVLMHGFTATRDEHLDAFCERFAEAGIAAVAFDFRHFGSSGGEPRQLLDLKRQYEDCDAVLAYVRNLGGIDGSRMAIWGTSFAGGYALDAAVRHPWLAACICLVPLVDGALQPRGASARRAAWATGAGLRDFVHARRGAAPYIVPALGPPGTRAGIVNGGAWDSTSRLAAHSLWRNEVAARILLQIPRHRPATRAKEVRCPMLVQVAEQETLLRNQPAERASRRATRGELRRYPHLDHFDVYWEPGFEPVIDDQIEFLKRHRLTG